MSKDATVRRVAEVYNDFLLLARSLCLEPDQPAIKRYLTPRMPGCKPALLDSVFMEAEARRNGRHRLPQALLAQMNRFTAEFFCVVSRGIPKAARNGNGRPRSARKLLRCLESMKAAVLAGVVG